MIKCNICGIEKSTRREMNGHLLRCHYDEYKSVGFRQSEFTTGQPEDIAAGRKTVPKTEKPSKKTVDIPAGFRLLNRNDRIEAEAYNVGYRYIDDDEMCYTADEAKESRWI